MWEFIELSRGGACWTCAVGGGWHRQNDRYFCRAASDRGFHSHVQDVALCMVYDFAMLVSSGELCPLCPWRFRQTDSWLVLPGGASVDGGRSRHGELAVKRLRKQVRFLAWIGSIQAVALV